jgi:hypothetical protein
MSRPLTDHSHLKADGLRRDAAGSAGRLCGGLLLREEVVVELGEDAEAGRVFMGALRIVVWIDARHGQLLFGTCCGC